MKGSPEKHKQTTVIDLDHQYTDQKGVHVSVGLGRVIRALHTIATLRHFKASSAGTVEETPLVHMCP